MSANLGLAEALFDPKDAALDIVFVHGLYGDRETTWTCKNVFWPKDLLPKNIDDARILSFGYDAAVAKAFSPPTTNNIRNHAESLVAALVGLRARTDSTHRPIIFVAHSLGGLVCAKALLSAETSPTTDSQLVERCTRRIAFLGTPFRGSKKADWGETIRLLVSALKTTNPVLLKDLQSAAPAELSHDLTQWLIRRAKDSDSKVEIVCFYEEEDTTVAFAKLAKIVSQESAAIQGYDALSIHADHLNMCKFKSETDSNYIIVADVLRRWAKGLESGKESEKPQSDISKFTSNTNFSNSKNKGSQVGQFNAGSGSVTQNFGHYVKE